MTSQDLQSVAPTLVAEGREILAADETVTTLTRVRRARDPVNRAKRTHLS